ncbi:hypothetical protein ACFE04_020451 [Oxalis oulophora]
MLKILPVPEDENRYNASRDAHLNLKRAEKARILVNKIPGLGRKIVTCLLAMLDEYAMLRQEREEEKRRMKIVGTNPQEEQIRFLTHFGMDDQLVSRISLRSFFILLDHHPHLSFGVLTSLLRLMELFKLGDPTMRSQFCNNFFKGHEQKPLPRVLTLE